MLNNINFNGFTQESLKYAREQFGKELEKIKTEHPKDYKKSCENIDFILDPKNSSGYDLYFKKNEDSKFLPNLIIKDKQRNHELSIFSVFEYRNECYSKLKNFISYLSQ